MTEEQALAAGYDCDCRALGAQDIPRALANRDVRGALKLVADASTGKVLGVHAALDGAGELMRGERDRRKAAVVDRRGLSQSAGGGDVPGLCGDVHVLR